MTLKSSGQCRYPKWESRIWVDPGRDVNKQRDNDFNGENNGAERLINFNCCNCVSFELRKTANECIHCLEHRRSQKTSLKEDSCMQVMPTISTLNWNKEIIIKNSYSWAEIMSSHLRLAFSNSLFAISLNIMAIISVH